MVWILILVSSSSFIFSQISRMWGCLFQNLASLTVLQCNPDWIPDTNSLCSSQQKALTWRSQMPPAALQHGVTCRLEPPGAGAHPLPAARLAATAARWHSSLGSQPALWQPPCSQSPAPLEGTGASAQIVHFFPQPSWSSRLPNPREDQQSKGNLGVSLA